MIRYAFPGCSYVLGQLTDGRILPVEVKARGGRPTPEQRTFLETVRRHRGVAVLARSVEDVQAALDLACGADAGRRPPAFNPDPAPAGTT
jgi:hypothetical protein